MTDYPTDAAASCLLDDYTTLRFRGPDAGKFLQGQLSNDLDRLQPAAIMRAGLHNPQGRTLALLWLAKSSEGDILALLPQELAGAVTTQLRRYLLRARLTITDESAQHQVCGHWQPGLVELPTGWWRLDAARAITLRSPATTAAPSRAMTRAQWRALDIAAGAPQVYRATAGQFVAQMLNLDCIDAVSFTKGCYTGQEVIARAHYRGRVKRRMQRFETLLPAPLAAGDAGQLEDGRGFRVVESLLRADGRSEFLAVAPLAATHGARSDAEPSAAPATGVAFTRARVLPLPYPLPE